MPAVDKLSLLNECLLLTGEHTVATSNDGSREWNVASAGYETGLRRLLKEHDWKFAKSIEAVVGRTDPTDAAFQDSYTKPGDFIHIVRVLDGYGAQLDDWRVVGDQILVDKDDGITVEGIRDVEPNQFDGLFLDVLNHFVLAGIYRGLKQQPADARAEEKRADELLRNARPRGDLEEPGKTRFISTLGAARRARRG